MTSTVKFNSTVRAEGRNGWMKQTGIEVTSLGDRLTLAPITSRELVGRGSLEIPAEAVKDVIGVLIRFSRYKYDLAE